MHEFVYPKQVLEITPQREPITADDFRTAREVKMRAQELRNTSDYTSYDHALAWVQHGAPIIPAVVLELNANVVALEPPDICA